MKVQREAGSSRSHIHSAACSRTQKEGKLSPKDTPTPIFILRLALVKGNPQLLKQLALYMLKKETKPKPSKGAFQ